MSFAEKVKRRGDGVGICGGGERQEKLKPPYNLLSISHSLSVSLSLSVCLFLPSPIYISSSLPPSLSLSLSITFVLPNRHFFARLEEVQLGM